MQQTNIDFSFEPRAGKALGAGWERMKANGLLFFLGAIILLIVDSLLGSDSRSESPEDSLTAITSLVALAYAMLLAPVIDFGCDLVFLKGTRGDKVEARMFFSGFSKYINVILANLLVYGILFLGIIALVIPGIYLACRLVFTSYLVMDEDMDPIEAVQGSWRLTEGHAFEVFLLGFMSVFIFLGGLILLVVGIIPAIMWIKASFASLYLSIAQEYAEIDREEAAYLDSDE